MSSTQSNQFWQHEVTTTVHPDGSKIQVSKIKPRDELSQEKIQEGKRKAVSILFPQFFN